MRDAALDQLLEGRLDEETARQAVGEILDGTASPGWTGAFLLMVRRLEERQGIPADALVGGAKAMRERMVALAPRRRPLVDTCGTGGDGLGLLNLSTAAALLAAACGAAVAKHGNRAASSRAGSADLLEAWGVPLAPGPGAVAACLDRTGFGFCFAPAFHPGAARAAGPRKALGCRTLFNLLGPLANPAAPEYQLLGVPEPGLVRPMAEALSRLGVRRALVFTCEAGADELIPGRGHQGVLVSEANLEDMSFNTGDPVPLEALKGGTPAENADRLARILKGEPDPAAEAVALNTGAALALGEPDFLEALPRTAVQARDALALGKAFTLLETLR